MGGGGEDGGGDGDGGACAVAAKGAESRAVKVRAASAWRVGGGDRTAVVAIAMAAWAVAEMVAEMAVEVIPHRPHYLPHHTTAFFVPTSSLSPPSLSTPRSPKPQEYRA